MGVKLSLEEKWCGLMDVVHIRSSKCGHAVNNCELSHPLLAANATSSLAHVQLAISSNEQIV
jgi:hypothetical protein